MRARRGPTRPGAAAGFLRYCDIPLRLPHSFYTVAGVALAPGMCPA